MTNLTAWWESFKLELDALKKKFPDAFENHVGWKTAYAMTEYGAKIESASVFSLSSLANKIEVLSKSLGQPILDSTGKTHYVPVIHSTQDALFALIYYHHLLSFQHINSTSSLLQNGAFGQPGIEARKPFNAEITREFKRKINEYMDVPENFEAFKSDFPQFKELFNTEKNKFEILSVIVLKKQNQTPSENPPPSEAAPTSEATHQFEKNVGICIHQLFEKIATPTQEELQVLDKELDKIAQLLSKIQQYEKLRKLTQQKPDDLVDDSARITEATLNNIAFFFDPSIKELTLRLKAFIDKHRQNKITKNDTPKSTTPKTGGLLNSALNIGTSIYNLAATLLTPATNEHVHTMPDDSEELLTIHQEITEQLQKQLTLLNSKEVRFQIKDIDALDTKGLDEMIEKTYLLRDIIHTDRKVAKYITEHKNKHLPLFLHQIFCAIYQSNHHFLKKYFLPESWKCTYEARQLRNYLDKVKTDLVEQDHVCTTKIRRELTDSLIRTKQIIELNSFAFFGTKNTHALKKNLDDSLLTVDSKHSSNVKK